MDFGVFSAIVSALALVYAGAARFVQNRFVNKKEMEAIQKESKQLSAEYEEARKKNDKKRMELAMQKQMEFLPKMNKVMMSQFKPMFIILAVFILLSAIITQLDPTTKDDFTLNMTDDGKGCDRIAGDGTYSACFTLNNTNFGKWTATAKLFENGAELGKHETYFTYGQNGQSNDADTYAIPPTGEQMTLTTDKTAYSEGETVRIYATPAKMTNGNLLSGPHEMHPDRVQATLSNGTYFHIDLPLKIPLVDVSRIYQPYVWFIIISLIANLTFTFVMSRMEKMKGGQEETGEKK